MYNIIVHLLIKFVYFINQERWYEITPYVTYYRETSFDPWQIAISSEYTELLNEDISLRSVIIPFKECTCGKH